MNQRSITRLFLLPLIFLLSCNVVELESPPANPSNPSPEPSQGGGDSGVVTGPNTVPQDESSFLTLLLGDTSSTASRTWAAVQFTLEGLSGFQDCRLDDQITLFADNTYDFNGGNLNCGGEDQAQAAGGWSFDFESTQITFGLGSEQFSGIITGINEDQLVITGTYIGLEIVARFDRVP